MRDLNSKTWKEVEIPRTTGRAKGQITRNKACLESTLIFSPSSLALVSKQLAASCLGLVCLLALGLSPTP